VTKNGIARFAAVLAGAVVLFGLEQGLGMEVYIAIPAGILAYVVTLVAVGSILKPDTGVK
jgi:hypothetical protein